MYIETGRAGEFPAALIGCTVADIKRALILETLKHALGNRTRAAAILGISVRTLRNKLNEYAGEESQGLPSRNWDIGVGR